MGSIPMIETECRLLRLDDFLTSGVLIGRFQIVDRRGRGVSVVFEDDPYDKAVLLAVVSRIVSRGRQRFFRLAELDG